MTTKKSNKFLKRLIGVLVIVLPIFYILLLSTGDAVVALTMMGFYAVGTIIFAGWVLLAISLLS